MIEFFTSTTYCNAIPVSAGGEPMDYDEGENGWKDKDRSSKDEFLCDEDKSASKNTLLLIDLIVIKVTPFFRRISISSDRTTTVSSSSSSSSSSAIIVILAIR